MSLRGDPSAHEYAQNVPHQGTCVNKKEPSMTLVTWYYKPNPFQMTLIQNYSFPIILNPTKTISNYFKSNQNYFQLF